MTQTIIFINHASHAESLHMMMHNENLKSAIILSHIPMSYEERDEIIEKFRTGEVSVFITSNMLARGIDVPEV